ncbi:ParB/RepB/Spo0J family partition protein [Sinomonas sp. P47F7]|uniref:ParB/RepB/Spo0J family partition protein n=1 Tax=Sinomonas sp. P47F7 TaxID=3410987 RepID=UPI003BF5A8A7
MSEKRRGLGRGLGALIPSSGTAAGGAVAPSRPVDLFFPESRRASEPLDAAPAETPTPQSSASDGAESDGATQDSEVSTEASTSGGDVSEAPAGAEAGESTDSAPAAAEPKGTPRSDASKSGSKSPAAKAPAAKASSAKAPVARPAASASSSGSDELDLVEVPGAQFAEIRVDDIHPNRKQPRTVFDEDEMSELVHSVREIGVLQPIVVRKSTEVGSESYELVMGERRWRAVQLAGLETIPAIIRDTSDDDLLRDALLENLHRSQLNPLEEAAAYQQLLEDFGTTHEELADRIGRSRPQVSNTIRLLRLPPLVQRRVAAGVLSAGHARALLSLPDPGAMERVAQRIVSEGLSVRATEEAVALYEDPGEPRRSNIPKPNARHERLDFLASSLADRLDTNVKITLGARKGRVSIEFASVEDLNRIMGVLSPGDE